MKAKTESIVAEQSIIRGTSLLSSEEMDSLGSLIVVTGPSGVGKGTVTGGLLSLVDKLEKSVSVTTRPMREGEIEGKDYFFRTEEQFSTMRKQGEFLEYAEFAGFHYGTPESWVEEKIKSGIDVILEIEVQGARQIRAGTRRAGIAARGLEAPRADEDEAGRGPGSRLQVRRSHEARPISRTAPPAPRRDRRRA